MALLKCRKRPLHSSYGMPFPRGNADAKPLFAGALGGIIAARLGSRP
jgi:hypothetical protein